MEDYRFLDLTGIEVVISKMPVSFSLATPLAISGNCSDRHQLWIDTDTQSVTLLIILQMHAFISYDPSIFQ